MAYVFLRYLRAEQSFDQIDVFEQQDSFGGVWTSSPKDAHPDVSIPQTNPNFPLDEPISSNAFLTPMYEGLETNIPNNLMKFSDAPFGQTDQLFPTRETVLQYLKEYGEDVRDLIQFKTQVVDVQLRQEPLQDTWEVETKRLGSDKTSKCVYDAVVVANGHYTVPSLPNIKGIKEWAQAHPDVIAHSKYYQNPASYKDKKVIVIGNSASGVDIAHQISTVAKLPVLNSSRSESPLSFGASWKRPVPEISEFLPLSAGDRAVRFKDSSIETNIDAVLFCTGYYYNFPFLPSLQRQLIDTGERVKHLYRQTFFIDHPSLAFIGLPSKILPFRTFEGQAAAIARVWANRLALPSKIVMEQLEEQEVLKRGNGRGFHVLPVPQDVNYHDDMVDWASTAGDCEHGKLPPKWSDKERWQRSIFPKIKQAFAERGEDRRYVKSIEDLGFDYDQAREEEGQMKNTC